MAVSTPLLVGLVADKLVDDALIHPGGGQAANEAVTQHMETAQQLLLGAG